MIQFTKLTDTRLTIAMALFIGVGAQAEVPVVQAPEMIELEFGQPFEYTLKASNEPLGFSIKGLPFWLEREGDILRGTPVSTKAHALTVYALNADGLSEPRKVKLRITDTTGASIVEVTKAKTETP
tara:strand:- start:2677 stop:3054 length:378 start_codon:yes stop_codon:yes gene_type:complete